MSPEVASKLAHFRSAAQEDEWHKSLQLREKEILQLLCEGKDNYDIAEILHLGHQTVKNYVSSIYAKMGVHTRIEAFKLASDSRVYNKGME